MFAIAKFTMAHMKSGSAIVNSTSVPEYKGRSDQTDYSSTKGAITIFTRGLSQQIDSKDIHVNGVSPGPIWTPPIPASLTQQQVESFDKETH